MAAVVIDPIAQQTRIERTDAGLRADQVLVFLRERLRCGERGQECCKQKRKRAVSTAIHGHGNLRPDGG
ncbi:MAG: hypothetical protein ACM31C_13125, partial [Acidobacteriota bacterium]